LHAAERRASAAETPARTEAAAAATASESTWSAKPASTAWAAEAAPWATGKPLPAFAGRSFAKLRWIESFAGSHPIRRSIARQRRHRIGGRVRGKPWREQGLRGRIGAVARLSSALVGAQRQTLKLSRPLLLAAASARSLCTGPA
jgi:hypothetical protein